MSEEATLLLPAPGESSSPPLLHLARAALANANLNPP